MENNDKYYSVYKDDDRFTFEQYQDKGHSYMFNDQTYINDFNEEFDKWLETLDYDYNLKENKSKFAEDKTEYINKNLDRERWTDTLDTEIVESFIKFYNANM
ncbi:MAG: hypothetical protein K6E10_10105 [Eubacterium sp.]|nr:hypothetical protein [Eubacterium sp.]